MGKPSTKGGFTKSVKIYNSVHGEGERARQTVELMQEIEKLDDKTEMVKSLVVELRPKIEAIVQKAFMQFCKGHQLPDDEAVKEWGHFRKILRRLM